VTLNLSANNATDMCIRNNTFVLCGLLWEPYSTTKAWTLPSSDGSKTVYALFRDGSGNVSELYSDSIILDTVAPTGSIAIKGGDPYTGIKTVNLALTAADTNGVAQMCIRNSTLLPCTLLWERFSPNKSWTLPSGEGTKTVYAQFMDGAGNVSPTYSDSIVLDTSAPTGSVTINGGATYSNSRAVNLAVTASDPNGVTDMCIRNEGDPFHFEPYAPTRSWLLPPYDGLKTVYALFQDSSKNISGMFSNTIILDATAPVDGNLTAVPGDGQVSLNWSEFYDILSGISAYTVVFGTTNSPPPCSGGTEIYKGNSTSFVHKGLTNGTMYYYRVCATDVAGNTSTGATATAVPKVWDLFLPLIVNDLVR
jgi:hypothetical protein